MKCVLEVHKPCMLSTVLALKIKGQICPLVLNLQNQHEPSTYICTKIQTAAFMLYTIFFLKNMKIALKVKVQDQRSM